CASSGALSSAAGRSSAGGKSPSENTDDFRLSQITELWNWCFLFSDEDYMRFFLQPGLFLTTTLADESG
ncbi:unnamed protein product, partial [Amoebophrya sp. A120]